MSPARRVILNSTLIKYYNGHKDTTVAKRVTYMGKIRVIIADDHLLFREGTRNLIEQEKDMEVVGEASNGEEAVELVTRLHPHVVLMDIAMPKVNGIEATRQIKARQPSTAVLILTAYDNDQYIIALLEAGAAGYLMKNVSGKDLSNAIRAVYAGEAVLHPTIAQKVFGRFGAAGRDADEQIQSPELSEREVGILRLAAKGMSNQDIAKELFLSRRTVQAHLANIFRKMDVGSRTEAVLQALRKGWLGLDELA
jgi:NarL family two-component system response regulator LiaR